MKKHSDALSRLVHEAVKIPKYASLNSKAEWGGFKIPRLTVTKSEKETKDELEKAEIDRKSSDNAILALKNHRP